VNTSGKRTDVAGVAAPVRLQPPIASRRDPRRPFKIGDRHASKQRWYFFST
jgi:hypothetical protein